MSSIDELAADVLAFWFDEVPANKRFATDPEIDEQIRLRFRALHDSLCGDERSAWSTTPEHRLAAIIVLDQWSRNLFRDEAKAFEQDAYALQLAKIGVEAGDLDVWPTEKAAFLVMPFMHSEDLAEVERSISLMRKIGEERSAMFAELHRDSIARFGRYPARNKALGRASTNEELAFLKEHPSGF